MSASDYPVTFPYGATSAPYSDAHPHRGDDHPCPEGTAVVIGSTEIGLTGATGHVIGAHLHIQEWQGDYATTRKPQNAFAPGTVTNIDPDGSQGDGSFGKFITIQTADGWNDTYCHLSQINVSVGQVIEGEQKMTNDTIEKLVSESYRAATDTDPTPEQAGYWVERIKANQDTAFELPAGLGGSTYQGDSQFREKARNHDADVAAAEAKGKAEVQTTPVENPPAPPVVIPPTISPDPNSVTVKKDGFWAAFKRILGL